MKMTQSAGREWRKRALAAEETLRKQRSAWKEDWPEGIVLGSVELNKSGIWWAVKTSRRLKHAVVVTEADDGRIVFHGLPQ